MTFYDTGPPNLRNHKKNPKTKPQNEETIPNFTFEKWILAF